MTDLVIPTVGDIWLDANGHHNLVLRVDKWEEKFTTLCLDNGKYWNEERLVDWNDPDECTRKDGKPFYRLLVA